MQTARDRPTEDEDFLVFYRTFSPDGPLPCHYLISSKQSKDIAQIPHLTSIIKMTIDGTTANLYGPPNQNATESVKSSGVEAQRKQKQRNFRHFVKDWEEQEGEEEEDDGCQR